MFATLKKKQFSYILIRWGACNIHSKSLIYLKFQMAFKRDALNRVIKFEEIAKEASLPVDKASAGLWFAEYKGSLY